jgi:membrane-associated phospholipid phosphatase
MSPVPSGGTSQTARARFGERTVLAFLALALLAVPFAFLVVLVTDKVAALQHVDQDTANGLHGYAIRHPLFIHAMKAISAVGSPTGWWVILAPVFLWLMLRRLFRLALFLAVTAIGSSLLNTVVKAAVDRARPHLVDPVAVAAGKSFPSGHAQAATVGCGILVLIFLPVVAMPWRRWLFVAAALVVACIGFSRIALGVHYLSDVIGGVVLGGAWLLAMTAAFSAWRREERKPAVHPETGLEPEHRDRLTPGE